MKRIFTFLLVLIITSLASLSAKAQFPFGRVLINEYMPWPGNACGTTAEFVELFNMGPGPVNIGCYILTDGDYTVTIPANTILLPGKFYVIAGQSFIPAPCANIVKNVVPDLNWNTCGCTNAPIPQFGEGFFTDGGSASEQVVLMDRGGKVVDAVVRTYPTEPSAFLISSNVTACAPIKFDLDLMGVDYETIGESAGRGNSIARKLDGDCGWVKDTQQTGSETNNTPNERYSFIMSMFITEEVGCTGGTARFVTETNPAAQWFPVDYILGYDSDGDGQFTFNDTYTTGIDYDAPELIITNLPYGLYAINIGPKQGCSYQNFTFAIGPCTTLGFSIRSFTVNKLEDIQMFAEITGGDELDGVFLEGSTNGRDFVKLGNVSYNKVPGMQDVTYNTPIGEYTYFRLVLYNRDNKAMYSPVRKLNTSISNNKLVLAGNPVRSEIRMYSFSSRNQSYDIQVVNSAGQVVAKRKVNVTAGTSLIQIPVSHLAPGIYIIQAQSGDRTQETFKVIKQQ